MGDIGVILFCHEEFMFKYASMHIIMLLKHVH